MMERAMREIELQSELMVADMLDALDDKLVAMFGRAAIERHAERITLNSHVLDRRRMLDSDMRFLLEGLR